MIDIRAIRLLECRSVTHNPTTCEDVKDAPMFRRRVTALSLILVLLPLLSACSVPRLTSGTITFTPSLVQWNSQWHRGWNSFFTCSYRSGTQLVEPMPAGETYVGYARSYDDRFCWEQVGETYRAVVQFDLSELTRLKSKLVVSADLTFTERIVAMRAPDGSAERAGGTPSCLGTWSLPDQDPRTGDPWAAAGPYTPQGHSGKTWRVTSLVSSWVVGSAPNTGILFVGEDTNAAAEDNAACISALSGFSLTVQYRSLS